MNDQDLYNFVIAYLKDSISDSGRFPNSNVGNIVQGVDNKIKRTRGLDPGTNPSPVLTREDRTAINQILWDLIIQRVLTVREDGLPWLDITEYGVKVIGSATPIPYDRDNYLKNLYAKAPNFDPLSKSYLEESLVAFYGGAYRASAVMLGVSSEQLFTELIKKFQAKKSISPAIISTTYKPFVQIRNKFSGNFNRLRHELPADLLQDLEVTFDGIYLLIKNSRDDSGHPTGVNVTRDQMFGYLALFPMYAERLSKIIGFYT